MNNGFDSLWQLTESLIRWQQINAALDVAGFLVVGALTAWCVIRVRRMERIVRGLDR